MATKCKMQETIRDLSNLLQTEKDLRAMEQLRATKREKALRAEMEKMRETIINQETLKYKALERERNTLLEEVERLESNDSAFSEIMDEYEAEKEEKESMREQRDALQKEIEQLKLQLHKEKDLHVQRQLRDSEREKGLRKQICDLKEQIRTERDKCSDSYLLKLKALERENTALVSQIDQMMMNCGDNNLTLNDLSEENVPDQQTCNLEDKLQSEGSESVETLGPKLEALESQNKVLSNELEELKISLERMAEKYMAEKTEKEAREIVIQELRASEREKGLCQEIHDLREKLQKQHEEESKLQAWMEEKIQEIADGRKSLRYPDLFDKLKAEEAHEEAIKEEQLKTIQEQQQEKLRASEREKGLRKEIDDLQGMLRRRHEDDGNQQAWEMDVKIYQDLNIKVRQQLEELKEKISYYEKGARPKLTATPDSVEENSDNLQGEAPGEEKKTKKRKGWNKFVYNVKPWHWGKK